MDSCITETDSESTPTFSKPIKMFNVQLFGLHFHCLNNGCWHNCTCPNKMNQFTENKWNPLKNLIHTVFSEKYKSERHKRFKRDPNTQGLCSTRNGNYNKQVRTWDEHMLICNLQHARCGLDAVIVVCMCVGTARKIKFTYFSRFFFSIKTY